MKKIKRVKGFSIGKPKKRRGVLSGPIQSLYAVPNPIIKYGIPSVKYAPPITKYALPRMMYAPPGLLVKKPTPKPKPKVKD